MTPLSPMDAMLQMLEDKFPSGTGNISAQDFKDLLDPLIRQAFGNDKQISAEEVTLKLQGITETFGGINPNTAYGDAEAVGNFDWTVADMFRTMFIMFRAPKIIYFTLRNNASTIEPIGKPFPAYAGGTIDSQFTWGTQNGNRVSAAGLTLRDITGNKQLASAQSPTGNAQPALDAFTVVEGISRQYRIQGIATDAANTPFYEDLFITGTVYRSAFVSGQDLLNPNYITDDNLSALILGQQYTELVYDRKIDVRTYKPRNQRIFFMLDKRLLLQDQNQAIIGIGSTFKVNGQPNDDFLFRDFSFKNQYGKTNNVRLFATANFLNQDFPVGANV